MSLASAVGLRPSTGAPRVGPSANSGDRGDATWSPVLDEALSVDALAALEAIADALRTPPAIVIRDRARDEAVEDASLAGGYAGLAILYLYLAKAGLVDRAQGEGLLEQAIEAVCDVSMPPAFYGGFTGVAWTVAHLNDATRQAGEDPNQEVDEALLGYLSRSPWLDDYDLVSGLVGLGVYALEDARRPGARALLSLIVDRLEETAEQTETGMTWLTRADLLPEHQRKECPEGYHNLGLAHGVPGVIAFLGGACAAGVAGSKARRLLDGAVSWLLSQRLLDGNGSQFPAWTAPGIAPRPTRSAWCYGDPGIAAALLCAARAVGDAAWEREALEIARQAAARPPDQAGVRDAGLCHGAAGLALLFNRMHQTTGDARVAEAARFWFTRILDMRQPGRGVAGYAAYHPREDGTFDWEDDPGLLTGAAGIALALLSAITPIEPAWDRMLLASLPPAGPEQEERTEP